MRSASSQMKVVFEVTNTTIVFQMRNSHESPVFSNKKMCLHLISTIDLLTEVSLLQQFDSKLAKAVDDSTGSNSTQTSKLKQFNSTLINRSKGRKVSNYAPRYISKFNSALKVILSGASK